ncbi:CYFA0S24e00386g1_1 [Cyberlindnera fabianii]|uniref:Mitochondrial genome maintenance protein MGM101 n=1 Tax=Cyberlindnera fabianii TaxID=36022 RepID=A0A061B9H3_CYBFA|nr:CYFA0S24e00386g1_1 [Cyberlindnera fabianii]
MLRPRLSHLVRRQTATYATATKKVLAPKSTTATRAKAASTTTTNAKKSEPAPETIDVTEDMFMDPPEFGLQVGQSQRSTVSPSASSALGTKTLNELFQMTLHDLPPHDPSHAEIHWPTSYFGLGSEPFPEKAQEILSQPINAKDIEIKPDGLIYLPEIKYRRILNKAFGAGGWGLVPRSETIVTDKQLTREYALVCLGRLVSIARGEQDYFSPDGIATATEGCRSNALMRCCKDLGIASELWDPGFIREFKKQHCEEKFVEHATTKRKRKLWKRKDRTFDYPYKVT